MSRKVALIGGDHLPEYRVVEGRFPGSLWFEEKREDATGEEYWAPVQCCLGPGSGAKLGAVKVPEPLLLALGDCAIELAYPEDSPAYNDDEAEFQRELDAALDEEAESE